MGVKRTSVVVVILCLLVLAAMIIPAIRQVRQATRRVETMNNMRSIAFVIHDYESSHKKYPSANPTYPSGIEHSWLVEIFPFFGSSSIPSDIDWNRTWDDPVNAPIFCIDIPVFRAPGVVPNRDENSFALTHFAANSSVIVAGPEGLPASEFDGSEVLLGEVCENFFPWGKPGNIRPWSNGIKFDSDSFGSQIRDGSIVVRLDCSSDFVVANSARPKNERKPTGAPELKINTSALRSISYEVIQVGPEPKAVIWFRPQNTKAVTDDFPVTDDGLRRLAKIPNIVGVTIEHNHTITDEGLKYLSEMTELERLVLPFFKPSDLGLGYLKRQHNLKFLVIMAGEFSDDGLQDLKQALPNCEIEIVPSRD